MDILTDPVYLAAQKNFNEKGPLGVTLEDHRGIRSTPPELLVNNPGKTKAELFSEAEIKEYLSGEINFIQNNKENFKEICEDFNERLKITVKYLESINKLPLEFLVLSEKV